MKQVFQHIEKHTRTVLIVIFAVLVFVSQGVNAELTPEQAPGNAGIPAHSKKIERVAGQDDRYKITLNVTGGTHSIAEKPKLDFVFIVDTSGSMKDNPMGSFSSRLKALQYAVSKPGGLTDSILGNSNIDARISVVGFSGNGGFGYPDTPWNDAVTLSGWSDSKAHIDSVINAINANGQTNFEAGLLHARRNIFGSMRNDAQKVVLFLADGEPNRYYDDSGITQKSGVGSTDPLIGTTDYNHLVEEALKEMEQPVWGSKIDGFYDIAFSSFANSTNSQSALYRLKQKASAIGINNTGLYQANDADALSNAFHSIQQNIFSFGCTNVKIMDKLSSYVDFVGTDPSNFSVVKKVGSTATPVSPNDVTITVDSANKRVTADFRDDFVIESGAVYELSFVVKPSQLAYDELAEAASPENKEFLSNDEATLQYKYVETKTTSYSDTPKFKITPLDIPIEKKWENVGSQDNRPSSVTVNLYKDGDVSAPYKTLTLDNDGSWKNSFKNVAKGHSYTVKEENVAGFALDKIENKGNDKKPDFVVTNRKLPTLSISKNVEGEFGDKQKKFEVVIDAKEKDNTPLVGSYTYKNGTETNTISFVAGKATLNLKHGEQIKIEKLPVGLKYSVVESNDSAAGYTVQYDSHANGTLMNDTSTIIKNTRGSIVPTGIKTGERQGNIISGLLVLCVGVVFGRKTIVRIFRMAIGNR